MRGLNVYCCPTCGHYGFFQLVANAVCPHCSIAMTPLPIPYQDFMDLDYPQRQILISRHMINAAIPLDSKAKPANKAKAPGQTKPSGRSKSLDDAKSSDQNAAPDNTKLMTDPSAAPGKTKSSSTSSKIHPDISKDSDKETLYQEVLALREKNEQLEQTVSWMHDLIWELTRRLHITQSRKKMPHDSFWFDNIPSESCGFHIRSTI